MSTNPTEPQPPADPAPKPDEQPQPRTFTQAELDQIIANRLGKFRDYDDLKAKATEYDKAQEAAKSELQKAQERAEAAEKAKVDAERRAFAATKGIPASLVTGSTEAEWEKAAAEALEWKGKQEAATPPPPPAPTAHAAGNNGAPVGSPGDIDAQIAAAEKARNFPLAIALKQRKFAAANT